MGRRSDHSSQELCEMIVDAAYNIIALEGIYNLSARKIAKEIGYTVGTLYNLFSNIDEIIMYVNWRTLRLLDSYLAAVSEKNAGPKQILQHLAQQYLEFCNNHYNLWSTLFEYRLNNPVDTPRWYNAEINTVLQRVNNVIGSITRINDTNKLHTLSTILWANLHGLFVLSSRGKLKKANIPVFSDEILGIAIDGFMGILEKYSKTSSCQTDAAPAKMWTAPTKI